MPTTTRTTRGLAVAAVAALVLTGCGDTAEPVAAGPVSAAVSSIPDDFPLTDGLPRTNADGSRVRVTDDPGFDRFRVCGETVWSPTTPEAAVDVAGATYTAEAEDFRGRALALYEDAATAEAALAHARTTMDECPHGTVGGTDQVYEEVDGDADHATFTHRYRTEGFFDTGLEVIELVRVGTALHLASYYGEGGGSPESIEASLEFAASSSAGAVTAMSVFKG